MFYGTTTNGGTSACQCGTVFRVNESGQLKTIYSFTGGADGANPRTTLIYADGVLYGTASQGGQNNSGTVFAIDTDGALTVLHPFETPKKGIAPTPMGRLVSVGDTLYGVTLGGGTYSLGVAFSLTLSGTYTVLHSFGADATDGSHPSGGLLFDNGLLYGATGGGGLYRQGTVYSLTPQGSLTILHSFRKNMDGYSPASNVVKLGGDLFGTTFFNGTLYSIAADGHFKVVHHFVGQPDGYQPYGELTMAHGTLYGSTISGGDGAGTVFSFSHTSGYTLLAAFPGDDSDGVPNGGLAYDAGILFGTAFSGGAYHKGEIFSVTPE